MAGNGDDAGRAKAFLLFTAVVLVALALGFAIRQKNEREAAGNAGVFLRYE